MQAFALLRKTAATPTVFLQFSSVNVYGFDLFRQHICIEGCYMKDKIPLRTLAVMDYLVKLPPVISAS